MQNIITTEFIEKFRALNGKKANIYMKHILYGSQKMKGCVPQTLLDGERIGFIIEDEERYLTMDELVEAYVNNNECCLKSDIMEFKLMIQ